jgi:hypothetical protein
MPSISRYEDEVSNDDNDDHDDHDDTNTKSRKKRRREYDAENDDHDDNVDNEDNENGNTTQPAYGDKKERKICKLFGSNLMKQAFQNEWEDHEIARLIMLIADELEFNTKSLYKFLANSECSTPGLLSILVDEGMIFTPAQLLSLVSNQIDSTNTFTSIISECMEQHLFDLNDDITLEAMASYIENFSYSETQRFVTDLCSHVHSKKLCGKILNVFTRILNPQEAASFIVSVIYLDFFQDLKGNMSSFLEEISSLRSDVEALLEEGHELNENGEPIYSDEDENGNLKGFVCDDDEVSHEEDDFDDDDDDDDDDNDRDDDDGDDSSTFIAISDSPSPILVRKNKRRIIDDD